MVRFGVTSYLLNCTVDSLDDIRDFRNRYFSCWSSLVTNMKTMLCGRRGNYNTTEGRDEDINRVMKIIRQLPCSAHNCMSIATLSNAADADHT